MHLDGHFSLLLEEQEQDPNSSVPSPLKSITCAVSPTALGGLTPDPSRPGEGVLSNPHHHVRNLADTWLPPQLRTGP